MDSTTPFNPAEIGRQSARAPLESVVSGIVEATGGAAGVLTLFHQPEATDEMPYRLSSSQLQSIRPLLRQLAEQLTARPDHSLAPVTLHHGETIRGESQPLPGLQATAVPVEEGGRVIGLFCLFHPEGLASPSTGDATIGAMISDQVQVVLQNARLARRLAEEQRWLDAVVKHSADGILILDSRCRIVGFNPALARLAGQTTASTRGKPASAVFGFQTRSGLAFCDQSCPLRLGTGDGSPVEVQLRRPDGRSVDVELNYAVIRGDPAEVLGAVVNVRDITERREAEELQSTFLSVVSHELQTPLAIIRGYADFLADPATSLPPAQLRQRLAVIHEESQRLSTMIENLLNASRIQAGGVELHREPLDLAPIARQIAQRLGNVSPLHTVLAQLPDDLPQVLADPDRVHDVLVNLVQNAIKYSPRGGTVRIGARYTGQEVVVSVSDQGIGIPEQERSRVFERFSRLNSRLVRERKGAGLGLFICKAIIEAHGGRIWIEGETGGGTRVSFSLPRQAPAPLPVLFGPRAVLRHQETNR